MEGITYSERINELIVNLTQLRDEPEPPAVKRELSLAITALEDAQMRVNRAGALRTEGFVVPGDLL